MRDQDSILCPALQMRVVLLFKSHCWFICCMLGIVPLVGKDASLHLSVSGFGFAFS